MTAQSSSSAPALLGLWSPKVARSFSFSFRARTYFYMKSFEFLKADKYFEIQSLSSAGQAELICGEV